MNPPLIAVSHNGLEKAVSLALLPTLELSDVEVENALASLHKVLRKSFNLLSEDTFYLYEAETNRAMTQESFRDPGYCLSFPGHWYLVVDRVANTTSSGSPFSKHDKSLDSLSRGVYLPDLGEEDGEFAGEGFMLPSLEDMVDHAKYHSYTLRGPGKVGCTLRHFSISQMGGAKYLELSNLEGATTRRDSVVSSEGVVSSSRRGSEGMISSTWRDSEGVVSASRRDSFMSFDSTDKLSTTFVQSVEPGSEAEGAGLKAGFVVHMIDEESILRSTVTEVQQLIEQCGPEVTLLGLPKDSDDLQCVYSKYTEGPVGVVCTEEGEVTIVDIPLVLAARHTSNHTPNHTHQPSCPSPPMGMVLFDDDPGSPDYSLSTEPDPLMGGHPPRRNPSYGESVLIEGSLVEIGRGQSSPWIPEHPYKEKSAGQTSHLSDRGVVSSSHTHPDHLRASDGKGTEGDRAWYNDGAVKLSPREGHTRYSGSGRKEFGGVGREKDGLVKGGYRSSEEIAKIKHSGLSNGLSDDWSSPCTGSSHNHTPSDTSHNHTPSDASHNHTPSDTSHNHTPSDASQHSSKLNDSRGHLSMNSIDESRPLAGGGELGGNSYRNGGSNVDGRQPNSSSTATASNSKPKRSYQSQREKLHKSRSKQSSSNLELNMAGSTDLTDGRGRALPQGEEGSVPIINGSNEQSNVPVLHSNSVDEQNGGSNLTARKLHSHSSSFDEASKMSVGHTSSLPVPYQFVSSPPSADSTERLVTTEEGEQYREIDIEAAIRKSQPGFGLSVGVASQDHTHSVDDQLNGSSKGRPLMRYKSLEPGSGSSLQPRYTSSAADFQRTSSPTYRPEVICRGLLSIKQEVGGGGRRGQDRAWRDYYALLSNTSIKFYKEKKDAFFNHQSDEPPLDVVPCTVELEPRVNSKRKHIFRVVTATGTAYLLQADDAPNRQRWVKCIYDLNDHSDDVAQPTLGGSKYPRGSSQKSYLLPPSPHSLRRMSSPVTAAHSVQALPTSSSSKPSFLNRIKKTLTRGRGESDMDYSSYTTFQQPLNNCPVSPENKRVPLVVEFCVTEVEKHGLLVEGIYRKPGLVAMINHMSAQMDKGHYMFEYSDYGQDVHTVGSLLKKFLKELPDPLIPDAMYHLFLDCARQRDEVIRLSTLKELVHRLPTAHYHTLRYLIRHLVTVSTHSEENKMTLKNVALVFGPTLMRSADNDMLANMSATYTIVELLCAHAESLFEEELCLEEQEAGADISATMAEDEEMLTKGGVDDEVELQKEVAMTKASPQSVRRIKNNLSGGDVSAPRSPTKRHSTHIEGSAMKVANWTSSGMMTSDSSRSHLRASLSSLQTPPTDTEGARRRQVRHAYEDVEFMSKEEKRKPEESRTMSWVNHHREINWGRPSNRDRELTGSLWSNRNREQQPQKNTSREKVRPAMASSSGGRPRKHSQSGTSEESRDLYRSYKGSSPQLSSYHHQQHTSTSTMTSTSSVPQPQMYASSSHHTAHLSSSGGSTHRHAPSSSSNGSSRSRRVSYMSAMAEPADVPVRESSSHHKDRDERFSMSEQVPPRYHQSHGSMYGKGRDSWKVEGHGESRYAHPSPSHITQQRVHKYSTLQQDYHAPPTIPHSLTRRRSSDTLESPIRQAAAQSAFGGSRYYYQQQPTRTRETRSHRTYSNDRTYGSRGTDEGNSPPQPILNPHQDAPDKLVSSLYHQGHAHKSTPTPGESYI